jgi:hypothetical protein
MPREARLRAERAAGLCVRHGQARSIRGHVQRPDARSLRVVQTRARDDRGRGVLAQSLLLLPGRPWGRGAAAFGRSGARRADGDELSRRETAAPAARHAGFCRKTHRGALAGRGEGSGKSAQGRLFRSRYFRHRRGRRVLQHEQPGRVRDRHATEQRLPRPGAHACGRMSSLRGASHKLLPPPLWGRGGEGGA